MDEYPDYLYRYLTLKWIMSYFNICFFIRKMVYDSSQSQKEHKISKPRGKESTELRISHNKGKESEIFYQKLKRSL